MLVIIYRYLSLFLLTFLPGNFRRFDDEKNGTGIIENFNLEILTIFLQILGNITKHDHGITNTEHFSHSIAFFGSNTMGNVVKHFNMTPKNGKITISGDDIFKVSENIIHNLANGD